MDGKGCAAFLYLAVIVIGVCAVVALGVRVFMWISGIE